jgi:hypothetical protein
MVTDKLVEISGDLGASPEDIMYNLKNLLTSKLESGELQENQKFTFPPLAKILSKNHFYLRTNRLSPTYFKCNISTNHANSQRSHSSRKSHKSDRIGVYMFVPKLSSSNKYRLVEIAKNYNSTYQKGQLDAAFSKILADKDAEFLALNTEHRCESCKKVKAERELLVYHQNNLENEVRSKIHKFRPVNMDYAFKFDFSKNPDIKINFRSREIKPLMELINRSKKKALCHKCKGIEIRRHTWETLQSQDTSNKDFIGTLKKLIKDQPRAEVEKIGQYLRTSLSITAPTETTNTVDTTEPINATNTTDITEPIDATNTIDTTEPIDTTNTTDTTEPIDTTNTTDSVSIPAFVSRLWKSFHYVCKRYKDRVDPQPLIDIIFQYLEHSHAKAQNIPTGGSILSPQKRKFLHNLMIALYRFEIPETSTRLFKLLMEHQPKLNVYQIVYSAATFIVNRDLYDLLDKISQGQQEFEIDVKGVTHKETVPKTPNDTSTETISDPGDSPSLKPSELFLRTCIQAFIYCLNGSNSDELITRLDTFAFPHQQLILTELFQKGHARLITKLEKRLAILYPDLKHAIYTLYTPLKQKFDAHQQQIQQGKEALEPKYATENKASNRLYDKFRNRRGPSPHSMKSISRRLVQQYRRKIQPHMEKYQSEIEQFFATHPKIKSLLAFDVEEYRFNVICILSIEIYADLNYRIKVFAVEDIFPVKQYSGVLFHEFYEWLSELTPDYVMSHGDNENERKIVEKSGQIQINTQEILGEVRSLSPTYSRQITGEGLRHFEELIGFERIDCSFFKHDLHIHTLMNNTLFSMENHLAKLPQRTCNVCGLEEDVLFYCLEDSLSSLLIYIYFGNREPDLINLTE